MGQCLSQSRIETLERRVNSLNSRFETHLIEDGLRIGNLERDTQAIRGKNKVTDQLVAMHQSQIDNLSGRVLRETM